MLSVYITRICHMVKYYIYLALRRSTGSQIGSRSYLCFYNTTYLKKTPWIWTDRTRNDTQLSFFVFFPFLFWRGLAIFARLGPQTMITFLVCEKLRELAGMKAIWSQVLFGLPDNILVRSTVLSPYFLCSSRCHWFICFWFAIISCCYIYCFYCSIQSN